MIKNSLSFKQAKEIVIRAISQVLGQDEEISENLELIGENAALDSMKLVELCLFLEEEAEVHGFVFDWTSSHTMSKSKSMFKNVDTLSNEFATQSND